MNRIHIIILCALFIRCLPLYAAPPFSHIVTPTERTVLDPAIPGIFQPTAAGTTESALYGSVRTVKIGSHLYSSFHEGIDIAPLQLSRRGVPLDTVRAVAAGRVGYINSRPGNSNYGNYVILLHQDPLGTMYTLYAHLAVISPDVRVGQAVEPGTVLGTLGNSSSSPFPMTRAHLHFEVGLVGNERFSVWFRAQKLKPDHGNFNGQNLYAVNPFAFFGGRAALSASGFKGILSGVPQAFTLLIPRARPLDYFRRYPGLWQGAPFQGGGMVITCSENGTVLSGRAATPTEMSAAGSGKVTILKVDPKVLGRNGCRLIVEDRGAWRLGEKGSRWLEILQYQ